MSSDDSLPKYNPKVNILERNTLPEVIQGIWRRDPALSHSLEKPSSISKWLPRTTRGSSCLDIKSAFVTITPLPVSESIKTWNTPSRNGTCILMCRWDTGWKDLRICSNTTETDLLCRGLKLQLRLRFFSAQVFSWAKYRLELLLHLHQFSREAHLKRSLN